MIKTFRIYRIYFQYISKRKAKRIMTNFNFVAKKGIL